MSNFNYSQRFSKRVINDSRFERFIWNYHNFGTKYVEPFTHGSAGLSEAQTYVPYTSVKPVRNISLEFPLLLLHEKDHALFTGLGYQPELDFNKLKAFYLRHRSYKPFIYEHPIYGDLLVRFSNALVMPKKIVGGRGVVQGFSIELQEIVSTDYTFSKKEQYQGDIDFPVGFFDVEIEYPDSTSTVPLGNNYSMSFAYAGQELRTFKVTCSGLKYFIDYSDRIELSSGVGQNMAVLELFYLKNRLSKKFNFEYLDEIIPVRFKEPLVISKINGNTGVISEIELTLIETPYEVTSENTVYEREG